MLTVECISTITFVAGEKSALFENAVRFHDFFEKLQIFAPIAASDQSQGNASAWKSGTSRSFIWHYIFTLSTTSSLFVDTL